MCISGLTAAKLDYVLPVTCRSVSTITVGIADPGNKVIAVEAALISSLQAEIIVHPV